MVSVKTTARLAMLCVGIVAASVAPASASFIDFYDVSLWTTTITPGTSNGFVDTTSAPAEVSLTSGDNIFPTASNVDFTITSVGIGTVSFAWRFVTSDVDGPGFDPFGYLLNGVFTQLTNNLGGDFQAGFASFPVVIGDVFGFRQVAIDSGFGSATTTISSFDAPVPEPSTLALLGFGLLGAGRRLRRSRKA